MSWFVFGALLLLGSVHGRSPLVKTCTNNRPVVGILSQTVTSSALKRHFPWTVGRSYFAASYVKLAESAGARVVPIRHDLSTDDLTELLDSINGVIFPGGAVSLSTSRYARTGQKIFEYAKEKSVVGDYFPVLGICLGFELLTKLAAGRNILQRTYASHIERTLKFTETAEKSRMFGSMDSQLRTSVTTKALSYNNHRWGIYVKTYNGNSRLNKFFKSLATSQDRKGVEFVAAIEADDYPIYGLQWHPEKPPFEWYSRLNMDHSFGSVKFSQFIGNFFINEARKSCHDFDATSKQPDALIYAYSPLYSRPAGSSFEQVYIF